MYERGIAVVSAYQQMNFLGQGFWKLEHYTDRNTLTADAIENITTPYSLAAVIVINPYHVCMVDSPPGEYDCVSSAVTSQCGAEIGRHAEQLGTRLQAVCESSQKWQRGKLKCCQILTPGFLVC